MQHALRYHLYRSFEDEAGFTMYLGPSTTGVLLEVGVAARGDEARIVHAMRARPALVPRHLRA